MKTCPQCRAPSLPKWVEKWRELERLVDKKYERHISLIGLRLTQFGEYKGAHVHLMIRKYAFLIGHGHSRLAAINKALRVIKNNKELHGLVNVDAGRLLFLDQLKTIKKIKDEIRIIKECAS